jgi:hypothetical protein
VPARPAIVTHHPEDAVYHVRPAATMAMLDYVRDETQHTRRPADALDRTINQVEAR